MVLSQPGACMQTIEHTARLWKLDAPRGKTRLPFLVAVKMAVKLRKHRSMSAGSSR